jgi:hypothetical protein
MRQLQLSKTTPCTVADAFRINGLRVPLAQLDTSGKTGVYCYYSEIDFSKLAARRSRFAALGATID